MDLHEVSKALSNPTRLNLLTIVGDNPCSAAEAHRIYIQKYDDKQRESIYRELEILVDASLLYKEYSNSEKEIRYHLSHEKLVIDLLGGVIELTDE